MSLMDFPEKKEPKSKLLNFLPDTWRKQCVRTAIARPEARDVVSKTDETEAPIPAPAAAPHTINTYRNDAIHSDIIALYVKKIN